MGSVNPSLSFFLIHEPRYTSHFSEIKVFYQPLSQFRRETKFFCGGCNGVKVTEVRIFPREGSDKKLRAFATITFDDCFVVRDIKIIEGNKGFFVAMPSRRVKEPCPQCGHRNVIRSRYCNQCGGNLPAPPPDSIRGSDPHLLQAEHKDVAHPITADCREYIQRTVLEAYQKDKPPIPQEQVQQQVQ